MANEPPKTPPKKDDKKGGSAATGTVPPPKPPRKKRDPSTYSVEKNFPVTDGTNPNGPKLDGWRNISSGHKSITDATEHIAGNCAEEGEYRVVRVLATVTAAKSTKLQLKVQK